MFEYKLKVTRVVDGDTVDGLIDLGFNTFVKKRIRLYGINAPETRTRDAEEKKKGIECKKRLSDIIEDQENEVILKSHGVGKFGRCLGELSYMTEDEEGEYEVNINQSLVNEKLAEEYFGGKR
jgi:micrococcal nuclease|tara:strand:+ start:105 stop:473 length:369 start_codon:yes stop_codon:yes gene_type:complete